MEGWPRGLRHTFAKCANPNRFREFESHTFRHINKIISVKCYGSTSVSKTEGVGSTPTTGAILGCVRHTHENRSVAGSNPVRSSLLL